MYRLVNNLTGKSTENPLQNFTNNEEELANNFADYFMDTIHKIHDNLHHDKCKPKNLEIPPLTKYGEMNVDEVTQIIQLMATKSCELRPHTNSGTEEISQRPPIIIRIVNISL